MGLYGILVVTTAPRGNYGWYRLSGGGTSPAVTYNAEVPLVFSEIDPVQNNAVNTAVNTPGSAKPRSGRDSRAVAAIPALADLPPCYPPAVNYTPLYYLINGVAFNKTNAASSVFADFARNWRLTGHRSGAHGECRPAHARSVDRRIANRSTTARLPASR